MPRKLDFGLLPYDAWPVADQMAWCGIPGDGSILDLEGAVPPSYRAEMPRLQAAFGRWLGHLADANGVAPGTSGLDHLDRATVSGFVLRLEARLAPMSVRSYLLELQMAIRLMAPGRSYEALDAATLYIVRRARPTTNFDENLVPTKDLFDFGFELMRRYEGKAISRRTAVAFRDGLIIALLAARPVRRKNLAAIEVDRHLIELDGRFWLTFAAAEMKNRRSLEFSVPAVLNAPLVRYLDRERPYLLRRARGLRHGSERRLWISADGTAMSGSTIRARVAWRTQRRFGRAVALHRFRHAAATSMAIGDPEHVGGVAAILGHGSFQPGERHYNLATALEAARHFQTVLQSYQT